MRSGRERLWIAMSDLWLDTDLDESQLTSIAQVVREVRPTEAQLDEIFALELAPFLGWNNLSVAGVWSGFDPEWVCSEARRQARKSSFLPRILAKLGVTTYAAKPSFERVKEIAFREEIR